MYLDHPAESVELFGYASESLPYTLREGHDHIHLDGTPTATSGHGILSSPSTLASFYDREIYCELLGFVSFDPYPNWSPPLPYDARAGTDLTVKLTYVYQPVPEPSTGAALGLPTAFALLRHQRSRVKRTDDRFT